MSLTQVNIVMNAFYQYAINVVGILFLLQLILMISMRFKTTPYFDKLLPNYRQSNDSLIFQSSFNFMRSVDRALTYCLCITFPSTMKHKAYFQRYFQNFNFDKNARIIDRFNAYSFIILHISMLALAIMAVAAHLLSRFW